MSQSTTPARAQPRMFNWLLLTAALVVLALLAQQMDPGNVLAVTLYKAHLMALGGWGGYWLDRALFPYDRPHDHLAPEPVELAGGAHATDDDLQCVTGVLQVTTSAFGQTQLRRAIVVAACLICVGLGA